MAFVQNQFPTYVKQPQNGKVVIVNGDGTAVKTLYTAGANGSKVTSINASSTDTASRDIQVYITNGGNNYLIGTFSAIANAGNVSGTSSVNLLDSTVIKGVAFDSDGNPFINLISGDTLTVAMTSTITAGKQVTVTATVGDF